MFTANEEEMLTRYAEAYRFYRYGRTMERQHIVAIAYLLCGFADLHRLKCDRIVYECLARKVFGREYMKTVSDRVHALLLEWGYIHHGMSDRIMRTVFEALLFTSSPHLDQLTLEHLQTVIARKPPRIGSYSIVAFSRVLASMGTVPEALEIHRPVPDKKSSPALTLGVPPQWARLCRLWFDRSTDAKCGRTKSYYFLLNVGRWLGHVHPTVLSPADWTRDFAAELISVVCQWHGEDWGSIDPVHVTNRGKILDPSTCAGRISTLRIFTLRIFFRDLQEWELIPLRFDPMRHLATPKSLTALIGPNPQVIADDVWAKLVWDGLNLVHDDLPRRGPVSQGSYRPNSYPIEMRRALAKTWLFAGLRNN